MPSALDISCPLLLEKKMFVSNMVLLVFWMSLFDTHVIICCHFVIPCQHSHLFIVLHLPSSLVLSRFVFVVNKLRSFLKVNTTWNWILTRDVWIWERLLSQHLILGFISKPWPSNNHNGLKARIFGNVKWVKFSLIFKRPKLKGEIYFIDLKKK
jgi:hypothetical protein